MGAYCLLVGLSRAERQRQIRDYLTTYWWPWLRSSTRECSQAEAVLVYKANSRTAMVTWRNPVSKTNKQTCGGSSPIKCPSSFRVILHHLLRVRWLLKMKGQTGHTCHNLHRDPRVGTRGAHSQLYSLWLYNVAGTLLQLLAWLPASPAGGNPHLCAGWGLRCVVRSTEGCRSGLGGSACGGCSCC